MKFLLIAIALSLLPIPAIAQPKPPSDTISGQLEFIAGGIAGPDDNCYGTRGFRDMNGMMPVIIRDGQENIVATGNTENGKRPAEHPTVTCIFSFRIEGIPKSKFYSVEIGRRGKAVFSRQELEELGWSVNLTLAE